MKAIIHIHAEAFDSATVELISARISDLIPNEKIIFCGAEVYYKIPSHNRLTFNIDHVQAPEILLDHLNKFVEKWSFKDLGEDFGEHLVQDITLVWDVETSKNMIHPQVKWINIVTIAD